MKDIFTTAEAARVCGCSPRIIAKFFDAGELEGFLLPGSKHRKIPRAGLVRFMDHHGIPESQLRQFDECTT